MALYLSAVALVPGRARRPIRAGPRGLLVGVSEGRRGLLVAVYAVTAVISIAFSYVSLYTWFAARERPAVVQRRLYDALSVASGRAQELLTASIAEGRSTCWRSRR